MKINILLQIHVVLLTSLALLRGDAATPLDVGHDHPPTEIFRIHPTLQLVLPPSHGHGHDGKEFDAGFLVIPKSFLYQMETLVGKDDSLHVFQMFYG